MLVDKHGLDVFEIEESFGWSYAISRKHLLPVVVRLHGTWHLNRSLIDPANAMIGNYRREEMEGKELSGAQLATSPSARIFELTRNYYGFELAASRVIRNPIEVPAENATWNIRTCAHNTLLFVGRFDAPKGGNLSVACLRRACRVISSIENDVRRSRRWPERAKRETILSPVC